MQRQETEGEEPAAPGSESRSVRILSIHKSKGLEFPFVFLCDTARLFNKSDTRASVLVHPALGLGPKCTDLEHGVEYPTIARQAIAAQLLTETLSEEMRLLYVAMTRAKERLVITGTTHSIAKTTAWLDATACAPLPPELLRGILEQATQRSAYAMQEMTRCGFVTLPGGHRLGICGTAVVQNGTITALREPSSLNLRIARQPNGIADRLRDALWARPQSVLLCGAPGSGKTTLLRDLIRQLSDRFGWRICVVDERLELAACASGVPQFRLGARTDVLSGAPKAAGIELLLRTMNPEWIAVDEITAEADIAAIRRASYCGVRFLATAHAADRRELESRPLYRTLLQDGFFRMAAFLLPDRSVRIERGLDHA